ncbi:signal peptide peptidase SppA [Halobacteriales archaeon SW_7_68_16]|nr:MAG: signal peptide peptidase SppA [Halobacteriales archaeon SW_7_68_16]
MGLGRTIVSLGIVVAVGVVVGALGVALFVAFPESLADLVGVVLAVAVAIAGLRLGGSAAGSLFADYNVAEVAVDAAIARDGGQGPLPTTPTAVDADEVVDRIEAADADDDVDALLLYLNTPGGEVVPSEDIRLAAERFDGPTVAYTDDVCASGGMWIASGCDELWVREASLVGSIGVRFSQTRLDGFADRYGISYERIVSGDYKDATGARFTSLREDHREYLQSLADGWYEEFVERIAATTELDAEAVADTEARVYLGRDAAEMGLADAVGTRRDVEDTLEDRLGTAVTVESFEPDPGLGERLRGGAARVAYAFGAGLVDRGETEGLRLR